MDWSVVATSAVSFLISFLTKTGEGIGIEIGKEIYALLKEKFSGDKKAKSLLSHLKTNSTENQNLLIYVIMKKAESDPKFGGKLKNLVEGRKDPSKNQVRLISEGDGNIQVSSIGNKNEINIGKR